MTYAKKLIHELQDGTAIESALFFHNNKFHLCLPSQVGCKVGCLMCATTYDSLSSGKKITVDLYEKILLEVHQNMPKNYLPDQLVLSFSGHGEPLKNIENIKEVISHHGSKYSEIHITTIAPYNYARQILDFNKVGLYFSLHEVDDAARANLIPNEKLLPIAELIKFANLVSERNTVSFNYLLLDRNTTDDHADKLVALLKKTAENIRIRFLTLSPFEGLSNKVISPSTSQKERFLKIISNQMRGMTIQAPTLEGVNIGIACGQLRAKHIVCKEK